MPTSYRASFGTILSTIALLVALLPSATAAHAALSRADPPANSQLREPPDSLTLYFTEPLERRFSSARVTDGAGTRLDARVEFDERDATAMRVILKERPAPGFLTVAWETVSTVDGHRITGSYPLTILNPDGSAPPGQPAAANTSITGAGVRAQRVAVKWLLLIAGSVVTGSLAFALALSAPSFSTNIRLVVQANALRAAVIGAGLLLGATAADLLNQAADLAGQNDSGVILLGGGIIAASLGLGIGLSSLVTPRGQASSAGLLPSFFFAYFIATGVMLGAGIGALLGGESNPGPDALDYLGTVAFRTEWGQRWVMRSFLLIPLPALVLAAERVSLFALQRLLLAAALIVSALYLLITSSVSHAAAAPLGSVWAVGTDFVHLIAASVWTGALLQLTLLLLWTRRNLSRGDRAPIVASALQRFSVIAVSSVALLLFTGVVSAAVQLQDLDDLLDTGYGRTLSLKLVLAAVLLCVGGVNAYIFRPKLVSGADSPDRRRVPGIWVDTEAKLARYARVELLLAGIVFGAAAILTQVAPPAAVGESSAASTGKFVATEEASGISATLVVDPNEPGENAFEVYLTGGVDTVELVRLTFAGPDGFASRLTLDASNPPTFYVGRGAFLSTKGKWRITVDLRRTRGDDLSLPFEVIVGEVAGTSTPGGDFSAPFSSSRAVLFLLAAAGLIAAAIVVGSRQREERPAGYIGQAALALNRVRVPPLVSVAALLVFTFGGALALDRLRDNALSPEQASRGNPVDPSPQSIDRGRILFSRNCIQCHGETGRGDGPIAASLPIPPANLYDHVPYHPDQFFFRIISNGLSGIMPAFGSTLSENDRWDIMNFLREQFGQPPVEK